MPYIEEVALVAVKFIEESGIGVLKKKWLSESPAYVSQDKIYGLAKEVDTLESVAIFLPCTGWHTVDIIEKLE